MFSKLAYAGAFIGVVALAANGCGGGGGTNNTSPDFSVKNTDGGNPGDAGNNDASAITFTDTTPKAIDTAMIGDPLNVGGVPVKLTGLVVLAPPSGFSAKYMGTSGAGCRYEVWAQDPTCTDGPCGILLETEAIPNPNAGQTNSFCPFASATTTALKDTWRGDVVTVTGYTDPFASTCTTSTGCAAGTVTAHQVTIASLTTTMVKGSLPAPISVTDTNPSMFVPYGTSTGWAKWEGTYIKLVPPTGTTPDKFTTTLNTASTFKNMCPGVTGNTNGSFTTAPGGAYFADTFTAFYIQKDAGETTNCWPTNASTFSSISGIVSAGFGGSILPTLPEDFQP